MDKLFHHIFRFRRQVFLDSGSGHGVAVIRISSLLVLLADCGGPRVAIMSFWIGSVSCRESSQGQPGYFRVWHMV